MCAVFRDAGSLNCSVQMGFISVLELTLECSHPMSLRVSSTGPSERCRTQPLPELPWKIQNYRVASAAAVGPGCGSSCTVLGYDDTAGWKRKCEELSWLCWGCGWFVELGTLERPNTTRRDFGAGGKASKN